MRERGGSEKEGGKDGGKREMEGGVIYKNGIMGEGEMERGRRRQSDQDGRHTSTMSSQGSPRSGRQTGHIVFSGNETLMTRR